MPKPNTRSESTSDSTEGSVMADIDAMVNAACQKALDVLTSELMKMFSDITSRLASVETRVENLELLRPLLKTVQDKVSDRDSALNDLSNRVLEMQSRS